MGRTTESRQVVTKQSVCPSRRRFLHQAFGAALANCSPIGRGFSLAPEQDTRNFHFKLVPPSVSGISWVHNNGRSPDMYPAETVGAGCAFFDYDNDGWMDIYLVTAASVIFSTLNRHSGMLFTEITGTEHSPMSPKKRACLGEATAWGWPPPITTATATPICW